MKFGATCAIIALLATGCGPRVITKDRIVTVNKPVVQPCTLPRPASVPTLQETYPADRWTGMSPAQKSAAVAKHAIELRTYSDKLDAATSGCE